LLAALNTKEKMKFLSKLIALLFSMLLITSSYGQDIHHFISKDPFNERGEVGPVKDVSMTGTLYLPQGKEPFPAVILSNNSSGTGDKIQARVVVDLQSKGYAVFAIESFSARNIVGGVGTRQSVISFQSGAADTLSALKYLRTQHSIKGEKICVAGHSRGGSSSFNFAYFNSFLEMVRFEGEPFNCNISINTSGYYRPKIEKTTGKPALIFVGELDDVWFMDLTVDWYKQLIRDGSPIELEVIKGSYHSLTSEREWCASAQTSKGCRDFVIYDENGITVAGKRYDRVTDRYCLGRGYHCGYGNLDKYPEMLNKMLAFLDKHNK
jgi:dienelactone hydrolase